MIYSAAIATKHRKIDFKIDLDHEDPSEWFILEHLNRNICYEPDVTHAILRTVRPGDFVVDVGANVGFFTILMSELVGPEGKVLAFECHPDTVKKLHNNLEINAVKNAVVIEQPLWCREEEVTFWLNSDSAAGSALWDPGTWPHNPKSKEFPRAHRMTATTLACWCDKVPRLIKIDVEGGEEMVLRGILPKSEYIVTELNPFGLEKLGCSTETFREYMRPMGYSLFLLSEMGTCPILVPPNSEVAYQPGLVVRNGLFSTIEAVGRAWPKVPFEFD